MATTKLSQHAARERGGYRERQRLTEGAAEGAEGTSKPSSVRRITLQPARNVEPNIFASLLCGAELKKRELLGEEQRASERIARGESLSVQVKERKERERGRAKSALKLAV